MFFVRGQSATSEAEIETLGTSSCMFCDADILISVYVIVRFSFKGWEVRESLYGCVYTLCKENKR